MDGREICANRRTTKCANLCQFIRYRNEMHRMSCVPTLIEIDLTGSYV